MKKNRKVSIISLIAILVIIGIVFSLVYFLNNNNNNQVLGEYLEMEEFDLSVQGEETSEYFDNEVTTFYEDGMIVNVSPIISNEKFINDNKVGMYGFKIKYDTDTSTIKYTIKNHTKEKINSFKYKLLLLNEDGSSCGYFELESKNLPALGKYDVVITVDSDVTNVYDVLVQTDSDNGGEQDEAE